MTTFNSLTAQSATEYLASPFRLTMGRRELLVCRDFRRRFQPLKPLIDFSTGTQPGHLEVVFGKKWMVILRRAR
ncbi:MAG: hypothetical protein ACRYGK_13475 [Janthinobacterium lividum]